MHSQTIQSLREEIEAAQLLETALRLLAESVDATAASPWTGPSVNEVGEMVDEDGGLNRGEILETRRRLSQGLRTRLDEVHRCSQYLQNQQPLRAAAFERCFNHTMATMLPAHAPPETVLAWVSAGALSVDKATQALHTVREALANGAEPRVTAPAAPPMAKAATPKRPTRTKKAPPTKKKPSKKATAAKPQHKKPKGAALKKTAKKPTRAGAAAAKAVRASKGATPAAKKKVKSVSGGGASMRKAVVKRKVPKAGKKK
jgi:hypothetical protein